MTPVSRLVALLPIVVAVAALVQAQSQNDAGRGRDAGPDPDSALRVVPVKSDSAPGGRLATWQGRLGGGDQVDTFRAPYASDSFFSVLVAAKDPSARYSIRAIDRKTAKVYAEQREASGTQKLEFPAAGEIVLQIETAPDAAPFDYGVGLWVAPRPRRNPWIDAEVKNPGKTAPAGFTFFVSPEEAAARTASAQGAPQPATTTPVAAATVPAAASWSIGWRMLAVGAVALIILGAAGGMWLARRRK